MITLRTAVVFATIATLLAGQTCAGAQTTAVPGARRASRVKRAAGNPARMAGKAQIQPWSLTNGKPAIDPGRQVGYFIWHDADYVYLATTDEVDKGQVFSGGVRLQGGTIANPTGLKNEKGDRFKQPNPATLHFHFTTHEGVDGVKFQIGSGATRIAFKLDLQKKKTTHIFLGQNETEAQGESAKGVLVFDLTQ